MDIPKEKYLKRVKVCSIALIVITVISLLDLIIFNAANLQLQNGLKTVIDLIIGILGIATLVLLIICWVTLEKLKKETKLKASYILVIVITIAICILIIATFSVAVFAIVEHGLEHQQNAKPVIWNIVISSLIEVAIIVFGSLTIHNVDKIKKTEKIQEVIEE